LNTLQKLQFKVFLEEELDIALDNYHKMEIHWEVLKRQKLVSNSSQCDERTADALRAYYVDPEKKKRYDKQLEEAFKKGDAIATVKTQQQPPDATMLKTFRVSCSIIPSRYLLAVALAILLLMCL